MNSPATIAAARLGAAHDGEAELHLTLTYAGGGTGQVTLDPAAAHALMQRCGAATIDDLPGHDWALVRDALVTAWNRYQERPPCTT